MTRASSGEQRPRRRLGGHGAAHRRIRRTALCAGGATCGPATLGPIASRPGLVDQYLIAVHPAVITAGPRMFEQLTRDLALQLVHAEVFDAGSVVLQYRLAGRLPLAVPYILTAAAAAAPGRQVVVAGHPVSCADLDQATRAGARRLLARGYRPGGLLQALDANSHQQLLCALAGSRIGLVLTGRPVQDP